MYKLMVFIKHGKFWTLSFKYSFWSFLSPFSFCDSHFGVFDDVAQDFEGLGFFSFYFLISRLDNVYCCIFKFVDSSVSSAMLMNLSSEVFILVIVLFS